MARDTAASCQKRPLATNLFDHVVSELLKMQRYVEAECLKSTSRAKKDRVGSWDISRLAVSCSRRRSASGR
jgi:hypothetical protein